MDKISSIIITAALIIGMGIIFLGGFSGDIKGSGENAVENSEIKDGIQYVEITARGGYSPSVSSAKSGIPTKIIVKTKGTYDCSAALVIRSLGYQGMLAQTGEEVIDVGIPKAGDSIQGLCSMGMYSFLINFI